MKRKKILPFLMVACVLALGFTLTMRSADKDDKDDDARPVKLLGSIPIPGNPIASTDIIWVDQATGLVVFADRSNAAVEVIDGKHDLFLGQATMGAGSAHFGGTGLGPNGVVTTRDKKVWASAIASMN
jgi:DNA-binding beta-propeller fold protein YncE